MRALIQRVRRAAVRVDDDVLGEIGPGLVVLLGVGDGDGEAQARLLAHKIANLRIFADTRKGRRPGFTGAARPEVAEPLVRYFCEQLRGMGFRVAEGKFGAMMLVEIHNDGPVTIWMDTADYHLS